MFLKQEGSRVAVILIFADRNYRLKPYAKNMAGILVGGEESRRMEQVDTHTRSFLFNNGQPL